MKITPQQYAKTLLALTRGKSEPEIRAIVVDFARLLRKKGAAKVLPAVVERLNETWNREHGVIEAEVTSREELSDDLRKHLRKYLISRYSAREVILKEKKNAGIEGGIIIRVGDEVLDASVSKKLADLKRVLTI